MHSLSHEVTTKCINKVSDRDRQGNRCTTYSHRLSIYYIHWALVNTHRHQQTVVHHTYWVTVLQDQAVHRHQQLYLTHTGSLSYRIKLYIGANSCTSHILSHCHTESSRTLAPTNSCRSHILGHCHTGSSCTWAPTNSCRSHILGHCHTGSNKVYCSPPVCFPLHACRTAAAGGQWVACCRAQWATPQDGLCLPQHGQCGKQTHRCDLSATWHPHHCQTDQGWMPERIRVRSTIKQIAALYTFSFHQGHTEDVHPCRNKHVNTCECSRITYECSESAWEQGIVLYKSDQQQSTTHTQTEYTETLHCQCLFVGRWGGEISSSLSN